MRNDRISPRRGTWDLTTTEVIGEGGLEEALVGMTERVERKTRAGAIILTTNRASGSGAGSNVIARLTASVVGNDNGQSMLKLEVVNTHTGLRVNGVVVVRRQEDGPEEKAVDVWAGAFSMDTRRRSNWWRKGGTPNTAW